MINLDLSREGYMRSMQWQLGMLEAVSEFAYRHRETNKNVCRGRRTFRILTSSQQFGIWSNTSNTHTHRAIHIQYNKYENNLHIEQQVTIHTHITKSTHKIATIPTRQLQILVHPGQLTAILTRQLKIQHVQRVTHQVRKYCMQFVVYFPTQFAVAL